jgi:prefoldin subunit 5
MAEPSDIEKKSLEAHVELCAERYRYLEEKLETVDSNITAIKTEVSSVKEMVGSITQQRNTQIINWGVGIIACLAAMVGYLLTHFVFK